MDNNYGYLDQEVEQFAAYADTLREARRKKRQDGHRLRHGPDAGDRWIRSVGGDHEPAFVILARPGCGQSRGLTRKAATYGTVRRSGKIHGKGR